MWRRLVARFLGVEEVVGSNPVTPTIYIKKSDFTQFVKSVFLYLYHQSRRNGNLKEFDLSIRSKNDLIRAIEKFGFVPYFRNSVEGFSIEENISSRFWFSGEEGAWEWKGPIIRQTGCAYGKFFENKAVYISRELFPDFANYRRNGYDFDALYEDGLARRSDKFVFDIIDSNAPIISKQVKKLGDFRKGGNKGFDTSVTRLEQQCYVIISDFVYMTDKQGRPYGWGVAEYSTPEEFMGSAFTDSVYKRQPQESYEIIFEHLQKILPNASDEQIRKLLK